MNLSMSRVMEIVGLARAEQEKQLTEKQRERARKDQETLNGLQNILGPIETQINQLPELAKANLRMAFRTYVHTYPEGSAVSHLCAYRKKPGDLDKRQDERVIPIDSKIHEGRLLMSWNRAITMDFGRYVITSATDDSYKDVSTDENLDAMKLEIGLAVADYLRKPGGHNPRYGY
jgi:hypothetical protein